jgi:hypothetical protein
MSLRRLPTRSSALLGLILCSGLGSAQDDSNWKLCGFSPASKDAVGIFYLQNEIKRMPSGNIQVWTKALSSSKLQKASAATRPNDLIFNRVVDKVAANYKPPFEKIKPLNQNELLDVVGFEVIADAGTIAPTARILWELDCGQAMYRMVSIITDKKSNSTPTAWQPVPPESTIRSIQTLICQAT